MSILLQALLISLAVGVFYGYVVSRRSENAEPILGGTAAKAFNYLGSVFFAAVVPGVLASLILRGGFGVLFPLVVGLILAAFVMMIGFAVIEQPVRARQPQVAVEEVWTEEKARKSGL